MHRSSLPQGLLMIFLVIFALTSSIVYLMERFIYEQSDFPPVPIKSDPYCSYLIVGKLHFASIPKSMSRMTKQILCELTLIWKKLGKPYNHREDQLFHEFCENHLWFDWVHEINDKWNDSMGQPTHFIIVRDPIDRFTSMFGYVCGLYKNCGIGTDSIHVTAQLVYEMLMYEWEPAALNDYNQFRHHFEPHTWYCEIGFNQNLYQIVYQIWHRCRRSLIKRGFRENTRKRRLSVC